MPDPSLSEAIKEAYAAAPSDTVILHTLELRHPTFAAPIRVVRNYADRATWVALGGAPVQAVLDAMDAADREHVGLVARLEESAPEDGGQLVAFIALSFDLEMPPVDTGPVPEILLAMDNVDRKITDALDSAATSQQKIEVTYRPYLSNDIEGPQQDPPITLTLSEARATPFRVTARARLMDFGTKAFPSKTYTAAKYPGLAR